MQYRCPSARVPIAPSKCNMTNTPRCLLVAAASAPYPGNACSPTLVELSKGPRPGDHLPQQHAKRPGEGVYGKVVTASTAR